VKPRVILRYAVREAMGIVIMAVALFWTAGRIDWWPAWAVILLTVAWTTATAIVILRTNPDLLADRLGPRKGAKSWDLMIMSVIGVTTLLRLIVAGLDHRYGWTTGVPVTAQILALVVSALGYALVVWATASNAFFSQVVRIQSERGQSVARGGPYRYVRHPAYLGTILYELAVPVLLASWWALIVGAFNALLFILRTALEDRTLQRELTGYGDYARRVRYRLLPRVW
jgi:protein-S-isoprenylcysteine O-methyltransferase Ste14